ncbi:NupC/NupG family nucleoside CNT transporter [Sphingomonas profundi]|uniref:NupC/NupG family nucleoside CNT transporter n=1 Tax=Alterirhizorhabdus profundi TaxID=2681549 RepID=UPI001E57FC1F|nr:nucleoside transporter C-terminal domain-containing protein [Sphingomonas profundi]
MAVILGIALLLSSNRRAIRPRVVGSAFALQVTIAVIVLYVPAGRHALAGLAAAVSSLLGYSRVGTDFLFGRLAQDPLGQNFALQALPTIIFFAALISILYYLGVMPLVVRWIGGALQRITGVSKVESLCAAANIFVGQSESPLVIRPYLASLTPPQLFAVMTSGMAGVAGTILAAYAAMGIRVDYLIAASFMAAPGGLLMAKLMMPDEPLPDDAPPQEPPVSIAAGIDEAERPANIIMAASQGAQTGVKLAVAVGAMVLAFVALVALANGLLSGAGAWFGIEGLTFQRIVGMVFAPLMYLINVPANEIGVAGGLFGEKLVLNEFVAFISLGKAQAGLSEATVAIVTFALCGFANFSSIAIQMAVTGSLAPNQRPMIAKLGLKALVAASLSNLLSAALAGLLLAG